MLKRTLALALLLLLFGRLAAEAADCHTHCENALRTAKSQNKRVLVDFTGSDWRDYAIDDKGFPTVVLLDPAGKVFREFSGYDGEGAAQVIAWIEGK
jgi:hypothetical protein